MAATWDGDRFAWSQPLARHTSLTIRSDSSVFLLIFIQYISQTTSRPCNRTTMPEHAEVRIMSEFINRSAGGRTFASAHRVERGNVPHMMREGRFEIRAKSVGKQLTLVCDHGNDSDTYHVFMGMSGNWSFVPTADWSSTRFTRLRFDSADGMSLLLHGAYMGPKFSLNRPFSGQRRGPDPVSDPDAFRENVMSGLGSRAFDKPLGETLLNQAYFNGIGAYLAAEILGRSGANPFSTPNQLGREGLDRLIDVVVDCVEQSYRHGGGELMDWDNPMGRSTIDQWIRFYGNDRECAKHRFGSRNIWVEKRWLGQL